MTQTQDEQNVQAPVESTPDLSPVDVAPEAPVAEQPAEQQAPEVQPEAQASVLQE